MNENRAEEALFSFAIATFQTNPFLLILVLALFHRANLGELLGGLNAGVGLSLFGVLWVTNYYCTKKAVAPLRLSEGSGLSLGWLIGGGVIWGGMNGALFLAVPFALLLLYAAGAALVSADVAMAVIIVLYGAFAGSIAAGVAFAVGAFLGLAFGLLDGIVYLIARSLIVRPGIAHEGNSVVTRAGS
jgi:hypothetical protein